MKFLRYRRPSLKTLLGITKAKKRLKKELGITSALKPFRAWTNAKRRLKRKIGYESEGGRLVRDWLPRPGGCLVVIVALSLWTMAALVVINSVWIGVTNSTQASEPSPPGPDQRTSRSCVP